ncbi:HAD family hydrolase [Streptomyces coacervatus]|uniref:HAD family hydrolase n=1 Tax=Streptomyces coacervatus TaxID=647381 RepID=A0ABP7HTT4_9ACTN|nr:HAD family phosphatase [Streptomyces coacervatus]MDF2272052.1 HAD family phosphatase [Streptomyces coacervatus]
MNPKALLFDFDGLICDTERAAFRSWQETYDAMGQTFPPSLWRTMAGNAHGEDLAASDLAARIGQPLGPRALDKRRQRKLELSQAEPLRPGVADLLEQAERLGVMCAVVSSSRREWVHPHLSRLHVRPFFTAVVTGDMVARTKPAPDAYLLALHTLGVSPNEALAFEDSPTGVRAAADAGIDCIAVPNAVAFDAAYQGASQQVTSLTDFSLDALSD